jgi:hypothetical protein
VEGDESFGRGEGTAKRKRRIAEEVDEVEEREPLFLAELPVHHADPVATEPNQIRVTEIAVLEYARHPH